MQVRNIVLRIIVLVFLLIGIISYIPELLGKDNEIIDYTFRSEELLNNHYAVTIPTDCNSTFDSTSL